MSEQGTVITTMLARMIDEIWLEFADILERAELRIMRYRMELRNNASDKG